MTRLALYLAGVSAAVTVWMVFRDRVIKDPTRPLPVKKAAAMLQEAWADHHTVV